MKKVLIVVFLLVFSFANATFVIIPMEAEGQQNHLKAYGITYWALDKSYKVSWLLNYRGGSFLLPDAPEIRKECQIRGVTFEVSFLRTYFPGGILNAFAQTHTVYRVCRVSIV